MLSPERTNFSSTLVFFTFPFQAPVIVCAFNEQLMRTTKAARITVFNRIVFDIGTSKTGTGDHYFAEKTD